jgi:hypothetical protein
MEEIKQSDLFANIKESLQIAEKKVDFSKDVPLGYVPVTMCTKGVLSAEILHFRNYTMDELLELTIANEDLQFEVLVNKVLNRMVYEKFDCSKLHIENIKQIMLTIYKNFWGNTLYNKPYYISLDGDLESEDNIGYVDIDLNKVEIKFINSKFKNPFVIHDSITGNKIKLSLPLVEHSFIAERYIKDFFADKERSFATIKAQLNLIKKLRSDKLDEQANSILIDSNEKKLYDSFLKEKEKEYLKVIQAQLIVGINKENFETIEQKLDAYSNRIDSTVWPEYKNILKENDFGVNNEYTFLANNEKLTRRFSFRPLAFIPSLEPSSNSRYIVSFDD